MNESAKTTGGESLPRILIVISNLGFGGAERQVIQIVNQLGATGYDITVCALSSEVPLADTLHDRSRLVTIPKRGRFDLSVVAKLRQLMRERRIDVVHGFLFDAEIATRLAGWLASTPRVIGSERNSDHRYSRLQLTAYKLTTPLMHVCIPNSRAGQRYNQEVFGLADDRYQVVYNGVDTERFCPQEKAPLRAAEGLQRRFVLGMVASFKAQKNHAYLLSAIARLWQSRQDFELLLVGSTVHEGMSETARVYDDAVASVKALGLSECVRFVGARSDVHNVYNLCDVTVLPSLYEGTPNVALESMACGVPVIATNVSDNAIVIPDGEVGRIVALDDVDGLAAAIDGVLTHPERLASMSRKARAWIETNFSLEVMSENMSRVYRGIETQPLQLSLGDPSTGSF